MKIMVSYQLHTVYILLQKWSKSSGTPTFDVPLEPKLRYCTCEVQPGGSEGANLAMSLRDAGLLFVMGQQA